jgi:hypothetical protein
VVPAEVTERFAHWEDVYWSRWAAEVLDRNEPTVPWEEAITELEIGDVVAGRDWAGKGPEHLGLCAARGERVSR